MELSPIYEQRLEAAVLQGKRLLIENILRFRFGQLDEELSALIEPLLEMPAEEIPPLLMQLPREELIARLRK